VQRPFHRRAPFAVGHLFGENMQWMGRNGFSQQKALQLASRRAFSTEMAPGLGFERHTPGARPPEVWRANLDMRCAPGLGFEPRLTDSESVVLPLHNPGALPSILACYEKIVTLYSRFKRAKFPLIKANFLRRVQPLICISRLAAAS
jgi:hypothetical protein